MLVRPSLLCPLSGASEKAPTSLSDATDPAASPFRRFLLNLVMSERQGIEIDYCPQCHGVWLDRGELDKIIERSASAPAPAPVQNQRPAPPSQAPQGQGYYDPRHGYHKKKKREGFLSDLFDFD
jgi:Zn-finger nucleic acid-binding protein